MNAIPETVASAGETQAAPHGEAAASAASHVAERQLMLLAVGPECVRELKEGPLETEGFQVTVASSAQDALALAETALPSVILVGGTPGDHDSTELLCTVRRLRAAVRRIPLLALCHRPAEAQAALEAGATDAICWPVEWAVVARRVALLGKVFTLQSELRDAEFRLAKVETLAHEVCRQMHCQAMTDGLTELPNRAMFSQLLASALAAARQRGSQVAVLFLDMDRFKGINAALGRRDGNEVLKEVGARLAACMRDNGAILRGDGGLMTTTVARLSGDEFTLTLSNIRGAEAVAGVAESALAALSNAFIVGGEEVFLSASIGIALAPGDGEDEETLLQHAEEAMYEVKRHGGAAFRFFNQAHAGHTTDSKIQLDRMLRRAFRQHELEIHYQPVVETATGKVKGAEALLRWNSPELGWVSPSEFIPIAEENGLIVAIGEWVLREACGQLRAWLDQGLPTMRMCVNLSRCQLQREDFPAVVGRVIEEMRLAPELVELELSERGALIGEPEVLERLKELDALGVRLAIDDFGTGHAAIACLKRLPLDVLKIDRSYVASITTGNEDAVITAATIAMAHHLQLEVVAEGVESDEQKGYLLKLGCDGFQGFVFSRALPPEDFRRLVAGGSPL